MALFRVLGGPAGALFVVACACAGPAKPGGVGASCFRAADCQPGLVCLMAQCTNDVSGAVSMVDGPDPVVEPMPDAGGNMAGAGGAAGAGGVAGAAGAAGAAGVSGGGGPAGAAGAAGTAGAGGAAGSAGAAGMSGGGSGGMPMIDAGSSDAG